MRLIDIVLRTPGTWNRLPDNSGLSCLRKAVFEIVSYVATEKRMLADLLYHAEKFGKLIFLNREEAEAALAKMKGGAEE